MKATSAHRIAADRYVLQRGMRQRMYILYGRIIDAVSDEAIQNGMVVTDGEEICYVGERGGYTVPEDAVVIEVEDGTILPGFIDAHAHLSGAESVNRTGNTPYELLLTIAHDVGELLDAGVTGVRDMSAFGYALKKAVEQGTLRGPKIMPGGKVLGVTGGHSDPGPEFCIRDYNETDLTGYLMDGVDECLKGVRTQFREGAEFIKICATGGVSSQVDGVDDVQFSPEELRVIVEEAKRHGTYVAAHCTGLEGAKAALRAGVTSIEHGITLDEECVEMMAKMDATLVSTLSVAFGIKNFKGLPDYLVKKALAVEKYIYRSYDLAHKAGVRVALGTDYSNSINTPYRNVGREFEALTQVGFSNMEAIKAGTINGAHLMKTADRTGSLEAGKLADIVIVQGNPLEDITLLGDAEHIKFVMMNGAVRKDTVG